MNVIVNTTIISNFAAIGRLDVLRDLLGHVFISTEVYAEIQDGQAEGCDFYEGIESSIYPLSSDGWLHLTSASSTDELRLLGQLPPALHRGEASSLAIAVSRGWAFLTDDALARKTAKALNVTFSGTLGVLVQAVKSDLLSLNDANMLLSDMRKVGYRSPFGNLAELL